MEICTATIMGINACKFVLTGLGIWILGPVALVGLIVAIWAIVTVIRNK